MEEFLTPNYVKNLLISFGHNKIENVGEKSILGFLQKLNNLENCFVLLSENRIGDATLQALSDIFHTSRTHQFWSNLGKITFNLEASYITNEGLDHIREMLTLNLPFQIDFSLGLNQLDEEELVDIQDRIRQQNIGVFKSKSLLNQCLYTLFNGREVDFDSEQVDSNIDLLDVTTPLQHSMEQGEELLDMMKLSS